MRFYSYASISSICLSGLFIGGTPITEAMISVVRQLSFLASDVQ